MPDNEITDEIPDETTDIEAIDAQHLIAELDAERTARVIAEAERDTASGQAKKNAQSTVVLAARCKELQAALRTVLASVRQHSNNGLAPWYVAALATLRRGRE